MLDRFPLRPVEDSSGAQDKHERVFAVFERCIVATDELSIKYPAGFENIVHLTKAELEQQLRLMAALKMFELGKLAAGRAAELAGISKAEFLEACGRYRVSVFNYPDDLVGQEIDSDLAAWERESD